MKKIYKVTIELAGQFNVFLSADSEVDATEKLQESIEDIGIDKTLGLYHAHFNEHSSILSMEAEAVQNEQ